MHPSPTTHSEFGCRTQRVGTGGVSAVNAKNGEGMVLANDVVRALMPVCIEVAVGQVVTGQAMCPATPVRSKNVSGRRESHPK